MRGRMQGMDLAVAAGGPRLASAAHGLIGAALGTAWAVTGGGLLAAASMLVLLAAFPGFARHLDGEISGGPRGSASKRSRKGTAGALTAAFARELPDPGGDTPEFTRLPARPSDRRNAVDVSVTFNDGSVEQYQVPDGANVRTLKLLIVSNDTVLQGNQASNVDVWTAAGAGPLPDTQALVHNGQYQAET